jgi:prepilin-type N-terminal cleavage/methylation domain-containing protein
MRPARHAFTLVELSIVLVIIGLLIGAVVGGQSLLNNARLRSTINDMGKYNSAVQLFYNEFNARPGDIHNATQYWGAQNSDGATCIGIASTDKLTCNGNGDGIIAGEGIYGGNTHRFEVYRAWQHLANAGLIEGQYSGVSGNSTVMSVPGVNIPKAKNGGGFDFWFIGSVSDANHGIVYLGDYWNMIILGTATGYGDLSLASLLTTPNAYTFDTKIDDGRPAFGSIRTMKPGAYSTNCATSTVAESAEYALANKGNQCVMLSITGY